MVSLLATAVTELDGLPGGWLSLVTTAHLGPEQVLEVRLLLIDV